MQCRHNTSPSHFDAVCHGYVPVLIIYVIHSKEHDLAFGEHLCETHRTL